MPSSDRSCSWISRRATFTPFRLPNLSNCSTLNPSVISRSNIERAVTTRQMVLFVRDTERNQFLSYTLKLEEDGDSE